MNRSFTNYNLFNTFLSLLLLGIMLAVTNHSIFAQDRPIPEEIPDYDVTIHGKVDPGFMFMTPSPAIAGFIDPKFGSVCLMTDSLANPVWYFYYTLPTTGTPAQYALADFNVLPDGTLSFGGYSRRMILDSNFFIIDTMLCVNGSYLDNHDYLKTTDGHVHKLCYEYRTMDASVITTTNGTPGDTDAVVKGAVIQEFDETGALIWEWKSLDHMALTEMVDSGNFHDPGVVDFTHANAIDVAPNGDYIMSCRHLDQVFYVERATSNIKWKLGGNNSSFTLVNDSIHFTSQHDCRFRENGNITIFDNGPFSKPPVGRMIEYKLDTNNWTAELVWEYRNPAGIHSASRGSGQTLPTGNRLISWSFATPWNATLSVQEVDSNGNNILDLDFMDLVYTYRAIKLPLPFNLKRPKVYQDGLTNLLYADSSYNYFSWSTGDTTRVIQIEEMGEYQVWVNQGDGYMGSEWTYIGDPFDSTWTSNICSTQAQLNWTEIPGAIGYEIRFENLTDSISDVININAPNSHYIANNLLENKEYGWNMKALFFGSKATVYSRDISFITDTCIIDTTISIVDILKNNIKVFPNPASERVRIKSGVHHIDEILITDLRGRIITMIDNPAIVTNEVDVSEYSPGVYLIKVRIDELEGTYKLVISDIR